MIGGPLSPENIRKNADQFTPAGARFILECCIERKVDLDGDTFLLLRDISRRDKPTWEPRTAEAITRARLESRGIALPAPRKSSNSSETPSPENQVEVKETDFVPGDEGEEQIL